MLGGVFGLGFRVGVAVILGISLTVCGFDLASRIVEQSGRLVVSNMALVPAAFVQPDQIAPPECRRDDVAAITFANDQTHLPPQRGRASNSPPTQYAPHSLRNCGGGTRFAGLSASGRPRIHRS